MPTKKRSKQTPVQPVEEQIVQEEQIEKSFQFPPLKINPPPYKMISIALAIIAIIGVVYYAKQQLIVATVNNQAITRFQLISELEKRAGKNVLDSLIQKEIVVQEAKKKKIVVTDKEVQEEIKRLEAEVQKQGQNFDAFLTMQNISRAELDQEIRLQKLATKLATSSAGVTDAEVADYIEKNKSYLPQDQTEEQLKVTVRTQLTRQKEQQAVTQWLDKARQSAKIEITTKF
ncbi:MAG: SurA N-terminal domain-containing protein [Candidatus Roizmanbacteria bacterium]